MKRSRSFGWTLVAACLLSGCGDEPVEPRPAVHTVTDSAGVEIVHSAGPAWGDEPAYVIGRRPDVRIGSDAQGEAYAFGYIFGAVGLSDGRMVAVDGQADDVRVFSEGGRFIERWGRGGEGPGEFGRPSSVYRLPGDTVVVFDRGRRSAHVFGPDGAFVRDVRHDFDFAFNRSTEMFAQSCCVPVGAASDGSMVWRYPKVWSREGTGIRPSHTTLVRVAPDASRLDTLGVFMAGEAAPWGGPNGVVEINQTTEPFAAVFGASFVYGNGSWLGYRVFGLDGGLRRVVRAEHPRTEVTADFIELWQEGERERFGGSPEATSALLRNIFAQEHADSLPAYREMVVDAGGDVWLAEFLRWAEFRTASRTFQVFGADGRWLGAVEGPQGLYVLDIGADYVLGVRTGEYDEQYLERYPLRRGR